MALGPTHLVSPGKTREREREIITFPDLIMGAIRDCFRSHDRVRGGKYTRCLPSMDDRLHKPGWTEFNRLVSEIKRTVSL